MNLKKILRRGNYASTLPTLSPLRGSKQAKRNYEIASQARNDTRRAADLEGSAASYHFLEKLIISTNRHRVRQIH